MSSAYERLPFLEVVFELKGSRIAYQVPKWLLEDNELTPGSNVVRGQKAESLIWDSQAALIADRWLRRVTRKYYRTNRRRA